MMEQWREAKLKCLGAVVNNIAEFDSDYTQHYKNIMVMGHKVWHVGPTSIIHRNVEDKVRRGHDTVVDQHVCLSWLDSKVLKSFNALYLFW